MSKKGELVLRSFLPIAAAVLVVPLPQAAEARSAEAARPAATSLAREIAQRSGDLFPFYAARANAPLWLSPDGQPSAAVAALFDKLRTAQLDNVDTAALQLDQVSKLVDKARRGGASDVAQADLALSRAFVRYVQAMRGTNHADMIYVDAPLQPGVPNPRAILDPAAKASSLQQYIEDMAWMQPLYAPMRKALADPGYTRTQREQIATNLARLRAIPGGLTGRYILVDADSATLWMYENGKPVDSMKVVVGKPELPTPMMAGYVRYAIVDPYWQVPPDLVQNSIAANVLGRGVGYLKSGGYQVLADWDDNAPVLDPKKIDWKAVRNGTLQVHVRQLPGRENFMGKVKFEFPNPKGIYLHDTPQRDLLAKDARQYSSGCVRLEDAQRLGVWLMKGPLPTSKTPEKRVSLPEPVPVFITYLTASPDSSGQIAFHADPYKRDGATQLAIAETGPKTDRP